MEEKYCLQSVDNALRVLELFQDKPVLTLTEIGKELHMSKSSVFRILATLENRNFVSRNEDGSYCLGIKNTALSTIVHDHHPMLKILRPLMSDLANYTGECAHLVVWSDPIRVVLLTAITSRYFGAPSNTDWGVRFAHMTSTGMAMLAMNSNEAIRRYVSEVKIYARTPYSFMSENDIIVECETIRKNGYAVNNQRNIVGTASIAVPIYSPEGKITCAISVSGNAESVNANKDKIIDSLKVTQIAARNLMKQGK